ncbi:MAG: hypothetical protein ACI910_002082 [Oleispira sp.]|jgi:hypothetical protein
MNLMKFLKGFFVIKLLSVVTVLSVVPISHAALPLELNAPLNDLIIYSGAAITMGESSTVGGNIQVNAAATLGASSIVGGSIVAGAAVTLGASVTVGGSVSARDAGTIGADSTIGGDLTTGDAATLGANTIDGNIMVDGDLTAGAAILVGAMAEITGNLRSGAAASADLGADAIVGGNAQAGTALTLGADAVVGGSVQAGTGAVALGVNAAVAGDATAGTSITLAAGASVGGSQSPGSIEQFTNEPKADIDDQTAQLSQVQEELASMPYDAILPAAMALDTTLTKGVYYADALTTTAGITLEFDGENVEGHWLINVNTFLAFGAGTKMILTDVTPGSTITWNAGSYTEVGADVELIGSFFAGSYILTGAGTTLDSIGDRCGGLFANSGAVTLGATNQIATVGCRTPLNNQIHHYQIIHDGQGLTCESETVTLNACTNVDYGSCTLSTDVVTLDVKATGSSSSVSHISFTGTGTASIPYTVAEATTLSVENPTISATNATVCFNGSSNSCNLVFADAGFKFLNGSAGSSETITSQIAGTSFPLRLQVVKNNDGVCEGLFLDNKNVDFSQENVSPGGVGGLRFSMSGNDIAKHSNVTNIGLDFGTDSIAEIPVPIYHDAGAIRLHAYYDLEGVAVSGSSNSFWVSPAELVVTATLGPNSLNGASAMAATTQKAGENFDLTVTALNSLGITTPNYSPGQIQLKLGRTGPMLNGSVDGNLSYAAIAPMATSTSPVFQSVTFTDFFAGVAIYHAAQYSEVGLLNLEIQDSNYGDSNIVIAAPAINIGRFIPDHFTQAVAEEGDLFTTCYTGTTFAYSGQTEETNITEGTISYSTNPILEITAFNKQGDITQNYFEDSQSSVNDYMKLSGADVTVTTPTLDQVALGSDNHKLSLTANMNPGILSQNNLTALFSGDDLPRGVLHYQLSDDDNFFYNRSANALVAPFTSDIDFSIASITDSDAVNLSVDSGSTVNASPAGVEIRFGRLRLENSFGPSTFHFPQPMKAEHFDGANFMVTANNNCLSYDVSKISLTNISLDPALTNVIGGVGMFVAGETQSIELKAPGAEHEGQIGVLYDTHEWLEYDWDNDGAHDNDPSAIATFGVFRGNDRIIYWREIVK